MTATASLHVRRKRQLADVKGMLDERSLHANAGTVLAAGGSVSSPVME